MRGQAERDGAKEMKGWKQEKRSKQLGREGGHV